MDLNANAIDAGVVHKIQTLVTELYDLISGPAGFERDWARQAEMFLPGARMIRTSVDAQGRPQALAMTVEEYPDNFRQKIGGQAFYEMGTHCITEVFGNIAHAFSAYEAWADAERTQFIKRGINSIQLYNDGQSWKVVNMIWDDERPGLVMPARYRHGA